MSEDEAYLARAGEYIPPAFKKGAFHCPFCHVLAKQNWLTTDYGGSPRKTDVWIAVCTNCRREAYWLQTTPYDNILMYPSASSAPMPHGDMPDAPRATYDEAAAIVGRSPRGACALLRLGLQELCVSLGLSGKNLNEDIGRLVGRGLAPEVQQALDSLRVIGNNAVHPGELDLRDDSDTAVALFETLNFIVEQLVTRPRRLAELYAKLPAGARDQIERRDSETPT